MDETDKEFRRIFEGTINRNVRASIAFGNDTRKLVHDLEAKISQMDQHIRLQDEQLDLLRRQLAPLQARVFNGGT